MKTYYEGKNEKPNHSLTISQMAKLRNININSLRYYEKLGILVPAYIDPQTRYRYYSLEQLHILDIILLCISLEIPLKRLSQFTYQDSVKLKEIFEEGQRIAEKQYLEKKIGLRKIEYMLDFLETEKSLQPTQAVYSRTVNERILLIEEYKGDLRDVAGIQNASTNLFTKAAENLHPTFMSGILLKFTKSMVKQYIFFELVTSSGKTEKNNILQIPKSEYQCVQIEMEKETCDYYQLIEEHFGTIVNGTVIISNMVQSNMQFETSYREIQVEISP